MMPTNSRGPSSPKEKLGPRICDDPEFVISRDMYPGKPLFGDSRSMDDTEAVAPGGTWTPLHPGGSDSSVLTEVTLIGKKEERTFRASRASREREIERIDLLVLQIYPMLFICLIYRSSILCNIRQPFSPRCVSASRDDVSQENSVPERV